MPGLNGLDVLSRITSDGLGMKVIFLSATTNDAQILTAITRGKKSIMLKNIFFFQAEDCIRHGHVTGVQTCALPICVGGRDPAGRAAAAARLLRRLRYPARRH